MAKNRWSKHIRLIRYNNLAEMVFESIKLRPDKICMRWFAEDGETVESITYSELREIVEKGNHHE